MTPEISLTLKASRELFLLNCLRLKMMTNITAWKVSKYGVFSRPYFLEIYSINLFIQSEYGKIRTRKTLYLDIFQTVYMQRNIKRFFHFFWSDIFQNFDVHFRITIYATVTNKLLLVLLYNKISQLGLSLIT